MQDRAVSKKRHVGNISGRRVLWGVSLLLACSSLLVATSSYVGGGWATVDALSALLPLAIPLALFSLFILRFAAGSRRLPAMLIALAGLVLSAGRMLPEWLAQSPPGRDGTRVILITHNLHDGGQAPERQAQMLAQSNADIILLQENDHRSAKALVRLQKSYPYRDTCKYCELAILSRWPMGRVHWRLRGPAGQRVGPALFYAEVHLPTKERLMVATVHAPRPLPVGKQAQFFSDLVDAFRYQRQKSMILTGDFNQTPWSAAMRHLEEGMLPMRRITRGNFSYPAVFPILPIDHAFATPDIAVESIEVMPSTGSDHRPIKIILRLPPAP